MIINGGVTNEDVLKPFLSSVPLDDIIKLSLRLFVLQQFLRTFIVVRQKFGQCLQTTEQSIDRLLCSRCQAGEYREGLPDLNQNQLTRVYV